MYSEISSTESSIISEEITWNPFKIFNVVSIAIFSVVGTIGNILIIGAVLTERRLKYLGNAFIVNLAVADLIVTAYGFPTTLANIIVERSSVPREVCIFTAVAILESITVSMANMMIIAVDRYFAVCHGSIHKRYFNKKLITVLLILSWVEPLMLCAPSMFFYVDDLVYDPRSQICISTHYNAENYYTLIYILGIIFIPITVCFYCYTRIFWTVYKSRQRVGGHNQGASGKKSDMALYRTLFIVFFIFVISWAPIGTSVVMNKMGYEVKGRLYQWFTFFGMINSVINGFIYGLSNKLFRAGYIKFIRVLTCNAFWKAKVIPTEDTTSST